MLLVVLQIPVHDLLACRPPHAVEFLRIVQKLADRAGSEGTADDVRALLSFGLCAADRSANIPEHSRAGEEGFENLIWEGFHGVFAPAKTSPEIVSRLANASRAVMAEKAFRTFLLESGFEATAGLRT